MYRVTRKMYTRFNLYEDPYLTFYEETDNENFIKLTNDFVEIFLSFFGNWILPNYKKVYILSCDYFIGNTWVDRRPKREN